MPGHWSIYDWANLMLLAKDANLSIIWTLVKSHETATEDHQFMQSVILAKIQRLQVLQSLTLFQTGYGTLSEAPAAAPRLARYSAGCWACNTKAGNL